MHVYLYWRNWEQVIFLASGWNITIIPNYQNLSLVPDISLEIVASQITRQKKIWAEE
jgi:hypothetical protein